MTSTTIRYMSDLHLEFADIGTELPRSQAEYTILAGDIMVLNDPDSLQRFRRLVLWLTTECLSNVIFIEGNHETYKGGVVNQFHADMHLEADNLNQLIRSYFGTDDHPQLYFLTTQDENCAVLADHQRKIAFFGTTFWTNMDKENPMTMSLAGRSMADYFYSGWQEENGKVRFFSPQDSVNLHKKSIKALDEFREDYPGFKKVVISHHAPSFASVSEQFKGHPLNGAFCSSLENHMEGIDVWVHGHVHSSHDYEIDGCRVLCNPRGYKNGDLVDSVAENEEGFNPSATFTL